MGFDILNDYYITKTQGKYLNVQHHGDDRFYKTIKKINEAILLKLI